MKLKTIILMLLAATIFAVGFQACKQANLKPEGLQMSSNPENGVVKKCIVSMVQTKQSPKAN
jgi:hypothetical protein